MSEGNSDLERISGSDPLPASLEPARPKSPVAWEPLTPRGVAAFARARWGRYHLVALAVSLIGAASVLWFVATAWAPVLAKAIGQLPDTGLIQHRQLSIPRRSPEPLAINDFLGVGVDAEARSNANVGSDIYIKFQRTEMLFCSFLGCAALPYPEGWTIQFNRPELEPWWGAWKPFLMTGLFLGTAALLMGTWLLLGMIYAPVVWLVTRSRGHKLSGGPCWRLAAAANLPGALWLSLVILAYGLGLLGLVPFCILALAHFLPAWVYVFMVPQRVLQPPSNPQQPMNPFATGTHPADRAGKSENVFRPGS